MHGRDDDDHDDVYQCVTECFAIFCFSSRSHLQSSLEWFFCACLMTAECCGLALWSLAPKNQHAIPSCWDSFSHPVRTVFFISLDVFWFEEHYIASSHSNCRKEQLRPHRVSRWIRSWHRIPFTNRGLKSWHYMIIKSHLNITSFHIHINKFKLMTSPRKRATAKPDKDLSRFMRR